MKNIEILVDCDGTILDDSIDREFKMIEDKYGYISALEWYAKINRTDCEINKPLLKELRKYKKLYDCKIILFTNRGEHQKEMTIENLKKENAVDVFDDFLFMTGAKKDHSFKDESFVYDNEYYDTGKATLIKFETFTGKN